METGVGRDGVLRRVGGILGKGSGWADAWKLCVLRVFTSAGVRVSGYLSAAGRCRNLSGEGVNGEGKPI